MNRKEYVEISSLDDAEGPLNDPGVHQGGLRARGNYHKRSMITNPIVTVITVVRNGEDTLEQTIQSVLRQTYVNIEYIIIDGASTDHTLDIIKKYEDKLALWVSKPDRGIYDAMNTGIRLATGEWINYMNAGDSFYSCDVIEKIFAGREEGADVIYGDHQIIYSSHRAKIEKAKESRKLWKGMMICHQSLFIRTKLLKNRKFDVSYRIAADFEMLYTLSLNNHVFRNTGLVIASVSADGLSGNNTLMNVKEQWLIVRRLSKSPLKNLFHFYRTGKTAVKNIAKSLLPESVVNSIRAKL